FGLFLVPMTVYAWQRMKDRPLPASGKAEKACPRCKTARRPGAKFCQICGTRLSEALPSGAVMLGLESPWPGLGKRAARILPLLLPMVLALEAWAWPNSRGVWRL